MNKPLILIVEDDAPIRNLMTTTLKSMADTIALLHLEGLPCKIMVGGAVLTPEYASQIQADFYARDAKESVDIAKRVIG